MTPHRCFSFGILYSIAKKKCAGLGGIWRYTIANLVKKTTNELHAINQNRR